jgi:hypothetical protein
MTLLYDSFGVRRFNIEAYIWPELHQFGQGELSRLYAHLNGDNEFESSDLFAGGSSATFSGEHWRYDIDSNSVDIRCKGYATPDELRGRIRWLLAKTREFFSATSPHLAFFVPEIDVWGMVPDDKDRHIGEVVRKRLLSRIKAEDLDGLPGLTGAGLQLVGDAADFHWHARIEPPHGGYDILGIGVEMMFAPAPEPPTAGDDLDVIDDQVSRAYTFLTDDIRSFASKLFV